MTTRDSKVLDRGSSLRASKTTKQFFTASRWLRSDSSPTNPLSASTACNRRHKRRVRFAHGGVPVEGRRLFGVSQFYRLLAFLLPNHHLPQSVLISKTLGLFFPPTATEEQKRSQSQGREPFFKKCSSSHCFPSPIALSLIQQRGPKASKDFRKKEGDGLLALSL